MKNIKTKTRIGSFYNSWKDKMVQTILQVNKKFNSAISKKSKNKKPFLI